MDLAGRRRDPFFAWDTVTEAEPERTRNMLAALPACSEIEACTACRDISNPGVLGTVAMMMEASGAGAWIDIGRLPVPDGIALDWWLSAYPSFGFVLAVGEERLDDLLEVLGSHGVNGSVIGRVVPGSRVEASLDGATGLLLDWRATPVTGLQKA
jgi:hypothetical protein